MPVSRKEKAIKLRRLGYSYKMISSKLQLSKSTLSNWLKNILYKPNEETLRRVEKAKLKSAKSKSRQKIVNIRQMKSIARREIGKISLRDLWMLGIGLYMGEGTKLHEEVKFSNSNPQIIRLMMIWFRNICLAKNNNFSASIHLYPDNDESTAKKY